MPSARTLPLPPPPTQRRQLLLPPEIALLVAARLDRPSALVALASTCHAYRLVLASSEALAAVLATAAWADYKRIRKSKTNSNSRPGHSGRRPPSAASSEKPCVKLIPWVRGLGDSGGNDPAISDDDDDDDNDDDNGGGNTSTTTANTTRRRRGRPRVLDRALLLLCRIEKPMPLALERETARRLVQLGASHATHDGQAVLALCYKGRPDTLAAILSPAPSSSSSSSLSSSSSSTASNAATDPTTTTTRSKGAQHFADYVLTAGLKVAIDRNNWSKVGPLLVARGADVDYNGGDFLRAAVASDNEALVADLLAAGANANIGRRNAVIVDACRRGNDEIVLLLLRAGAKPSNLAVSVCRSPAGLKRLIEAGGVDPRTENDAALANMCAVGSAAMVKELIEEHGANPFTLDNFYVHQACIHGHLNVLSVLLEKGCAPSLLQPGDFRGVKSSSHFASAFSSPSSSPSSVLGLASSSAPAFMPPSPPSSPPSSSSSSFISNLLPLFSPALSNQSSPFSTEGASTTTTTTTNRRNSSSINASIALARHPRPSKRSFRREPVHEAARLGHREIVRALLDAGAPAPGLAAYDAARAGHTAIAAMLVTAGAPDALERAGRLVHLAGLGNVTGMRRCLDCDEEETPQGRHVVVLGRADRAAIAAFDDNEALKAAGRGGFVDAARLLLEFGAGGDTVDTPLLAACCSSGEPDIIMEIFSQGKMVSQESLDVALNSAAEAGHPRVVDALLRAGARLKENAGFDQALYHAVNHGHPDVVRLLLTPPPVTIAVRSPASAAPVLSVAALSSWLASLSQKKTWLPPILTTAPAPEQQNPQPQPLPAVAGPLAERLLTGAVTGRSLATLDIVLACGASPDRSRFWSVYRAATAAGASREVLHALVHHHAARDHALIAKRMRRAGAPRREAEAWGAAHGVPRDAVRAALEAVAAETAETGAAAGDAGITQVGRTWPATPLEGLASTGLAENVGRLVDVGGEPFWNGGPAAVVVAARCGHTALLRSLCERWARLVLAMGDRRDDARGGGRDGCGDGGGGGGAERRAEGGAAEHGDDARDKGKGRATAADPPEDNADASYCDAEAASDLASALRVWRETLQAALQAAVSGRHAACLEYLLDARFLLCAARPPSPSPRPLSLLPVPAPLSSPSSSSSSAAQAGASTALSLSLPADPVAVPAGLLVQAAAAGVPAGTTPDPSSVRALLRHLSGATGASHENGTSGDGSGISRAELTATLEASALAQRHDALRTVLASLGGGGVNGNSADGTSGDDGGGAVVGCGSIDLGPALAAALFVGDAEAAQLLRAAGASATARVTAAVQLRRGARFGDAAAVRSALELQAAGDGGVLDINANDGEALRDAAARGHAEVVRALVAAGADLARREHEALRFASAAGHGEVVRALLAGAGGSASGSASGVHARDDEALRVAADRGHVEVVRALVAAGADVHARGGEAGKRALERGHGTVVHVLRIAGWRP
ncbi:ankyrin repeat-containing domain protein [Zopfochytrium polystomum]|nr:ankyrin repeat-containing domain protein [Zopfochytrium polystomum]